MELFGALTTSMGFSTVRSRTLSMDSSTRHLHALSHLAAIISNLCPDNWCAPAPDRRPAGVGMVPNDGQGPVLRITAADRDVEQVEGGNKVRVRHNGWTSTLR